MNVITTPLGPVGLFSIAYLSLLFGNFSRRLTAVTKMEDHYRWFPLAGLLIGLAAMSQLIRGTAIVAQSPPQFLCTPLFALLSFHLPLALGVTLDLVLVWYYWAWILREKIE